MIAGFGRPKNISQVCVLRCSTLARNRHVEQVATVYLQARFGLLNTNLLRLSVRMGFYLSSRGVYESDARLPSRIH
eukprot:COSAG02_NODE_373_length_23594_cov_6.892190_5_plen_76_part_00